MAAVWVRAVYNFSLNILPSNFSIVTSINVITIAGRRQCVGELLARMQLYLYTANIVQNFDVEVPQGAVLRDQDVENALGLRIPMDT